MPVADCNKITLVQFGQNADDAVSTRYLSGILRSRGYEVTIVCLALSTKGGSGLRWDYDGYDISDNAIKNLLEVCRGSLFIGFTVYSFVAHIVRKIYTAVYNREGIPVVVGGPHPTLDPYNSSSFSDYVCVGDGENAIVELAQKLKQGNIAIPEDCSLSVAENVFSSAALRRSREQRILRGKEAPINSQTMPDYSFESEYCFSGDTSERITKENAHKHIGTYATFFSRGCVNNCSFCGHEMISLRSGFQKRVKSKDVSHFIRELNTIRDGLPWVNRVVFFDPNILSNKHDSLKAIMSEYRSAVKLPLTLTGLTFNQIGEEMLNDFLASGVNSVIFGIESASENTKKLFNRRESKDQILKIDELNYRLKKEFFFHVQYDIIVDTPWESPDDALESLLFISRLKGYDYLDIFSLRFFPGTKLFQKALDDGVLKREDVNRENQRVYRAMNCTYENFMLLLLRDNFLRGGWFFRIALRPRVAGVMRKFFNRHGKSILMLYTSRTGLQAASLWKKMNKALKLIERYGVRKAIKIIHKGFLDNG